VEQGVDAREIECAVLQDATGEILISVPGEILIDKKFEFYDFDAKYIDGSTKLVIPAEVSPDLAREMQEMAREAFIAMQCEGLARVDFFLTPDGPMLNEINTMPGFTSGSMYPLLWAASGIDYKTLITLLIEEALARPLTIFR
jgi:D-alanine-D-alanine ligase